jgi:hypothetical protein
MALVFQVIEMSRIKAAGETTKSGSRRREMMIIAVS